jgi:HTH-type transcriptional regulator, global nitrogen regulator NrpRI
MRDKIEKKRLSILKILRDQGEPFSSHALTEVLNGMGVEISERTVRFHLLAMDNEGLTELVGRQGRQITKDGSDELDRSRIFEKVGFLRARIDQMAYEMDYNVSSKSGSVIVNISLIHMDQLKEAVPLIINSFETGYTMGRFVTFFKEGDKVGIQRIPEGYCGLGTICSITLNGVLLKNGIPAVSRFGGLLEIENHEPVRFVEIVEYSGSTIDPLEIFIKSRMTDMRAALEGKECRIGASFLEIPSATREHVEEISHKLKTDGLGSFMKIGWQGQPLCGIPINEGRLGAISIGGLNAVAILEEKGFDVYSHALSGLMDFHKLFDYTELAKLPFD